jgi:hypothetical protein
MTAPDGNQPCDGAGLVGGGVDALPPDGQRTARGRTGTEGTALNDMAARLRSSPFRTQGIPANRPVPENRFGIPETGMGCARSATPVEPPKAGLTAGLATLVVRRCRARSSVEGSACLDVS